jgi:hypothetical protein
VLRRACVVTPLLVCCPAAQILRSVSLWSQGIDTESSILNAYIETIAEAKHYLYIEVRPREAASLLLSSAGCWRDMP